MKTFALLALLSFASLANSQFIFSGGLSAQANGDDPSASGMRAYPSYLAEFRICRMPDLVVIRLEMPHAGMGIKEKTFSR